MTLNFQTTSLKNNQTQTLLKPTPKPGLKKFQTQTPNPNPTSEILKPQTHIQTPLEF